MVLMLFCSETWGKGGGVLGDNFVNRDSGRHQGAKWHPDCTLMMCMHKHLVHAQDCFACTRTSCTHENLAFVTLCDKTLIVYLIVFQARHLFQLHDALPMIASIGSPHQNPTYRNGANIYIYI